MLLILIIILALLLAGLPQTGVHQWGYAPSGLLGVILIVVLVYLLLYGRL